MDMLKILRQMAGETGSFQEELQKVYEDVPLPSCAPVPAPAPVPQKLRQMRRLTGYLIPPGRSVPERTTESLFYEQGRFMEHYTDDYAEAVTCQRAAPTYASMSYPELRAYFTWRTRWRNWDAPPVQYPFLLLYTGELINLIGEPDAKNAYRQLRRLYEAYGNRIPAFGRQCRVWLADFAAYYRLPYEPVSDAEKAFITVLQYDSRTPAELLGALESTSSYRLTASKSYLADPGRTEHLFAAVFAALSRHYAAQKQHSYAECLLGKKRRTEHIMFSGCLLYPHFSPQEGVWRISPAYTYYRYAGRWALECFSSDPHAVTLRRHGIGALLRTFDSVLREETNFRNKLKPDVLPAGDAECIRAAVRAYLQPQTPHPAQVIRLDTAELENIRQAAARTTDLLTLPGTEEEPETICSPLPEPVVPAPAAAQAGKETGLPELSAPAAVLLRCLLNGEPPEPLAAQGQMLSVLAEEINEAFYEEFADTVLDTAGDTPALIEDYAGELREMLKRMLEQ